MVFVSLGALEKSSRLTSTMQKKLSPGFTFQSENVNVKVKQHSHSYNSILFQKRELDKDMDLDWPWLLNWWCSILLFVSWFWICSSNVIWISCTMFWVTMNNWYFFKNSPIQLMSDMLRQIVRNMGQNIWLA